jgi:DNA adenine methylase
VTANSKKSPVARLADTSRGGERKASPFLKWAGGKTQLLSTFDEYFPDRFERYFEPFLGGGAVFFRMNAREDGVTAHLSDLNDELINCYSVVRDNVEQLIKALKKHRNESDYYYGVRAMDTSRMTPVARAARLIYLNKTCFNGLYRVNRKGEFNVPFGSYKNPRTCDEDNLRAASDALRNARVEHKPFENALKTAKKGDFVYLDPPYQPLSATSSFTSYTSKCFGELDQKRLAEVFAELDRRGCKVMLSNSDNEFVRELYKQFRLETVYANRAINCRADRRGRISELLVLNY